MGDHAAHRQMGQLPEPRSAPVTALPSPDGNSTANLGPPTAYPIPTSPGREPKLPRQYERESPSLRGSNGLRHLAATYNQPYYAPLSRHDPYEAQRQMYAGRAMSQPSSYSHQHPLPAQQSYDRYHPYQQPARSTRPSPHPSSEASLSSGPPMSAHSPFQHSYHEGSVRDPRERDVTDGHQPSPPHPYHQQNSYRPDPPLSSHSYPDPSDHFRGSDHYRNGIGISQFSSAATPYYRDGKRSPEGTYRDLMPDGHYSDPVRGPSDHAYRGQSVSQTQWSGHHLFPPPSSNAAAKSPKMSIPSTLLNPESVTSGGLTLPPLRLAIDETDRRVPSRNNSPQQGRFSPRAASDSGSSSQGDSTRRKRGG